MSWAHLRTARLYGRPAAIFCVSLVGLIFLLHRLPAVQQLRSHSIYGPQHDEAPAGIQLSDGADYLLAQPYPPAWELDDSQPTGLCYDRYGMGYLHGFSKRPTNYCDVNSTARLMCFSYRVRDEQTDSFCLGGPSILNEGAGTFTLDCGVRHLDREETEKGVPQLDDFPEYFFNTGPHVIMNEHLELEHLPEPVSSVKSPISDVESHGISILVLREDSNQNLWHTMLQIMSLELSIDVLRTTVDHTTGKPFVSDRALENSRVVFLDDLADGPYYDLWSLFTGKSSVRLSKVSPPDLSPTLLIPLPGGSNPFWRDWVDVYCGQSRLLKKFSRRVLEFYNISDSPRSPEKPLTITQIDRPHKRRLVDQEILWAALKAKYPNIEMRLVDYATLSLAEQIELSHSTDILVGVHGAGMTQGMFLPPNATMVEILPPNLMHKGYHNIARFLGHNYFSRHGSEHESQANNGDWHDDDVYIEITQFMDLLEEAIASVGR